MKILLDEVTLNSDIVYNRLMSYLDNVSRYQNFDENMMMRIFVNKDKDFTAVEAVDYRIEFTSSAHKLLETLKSPYIIDPVPFTDFYRHLVKIRR